MRRLAKEAAHAVALAEGYKAQIDSLERAAPMNRGNEPASETPDVAGPSRCVVVCIAVVVIAYLTAITCSAAGGIDRPTGAGAGGVPGPSTPKALVRAAGSRGSFIFGGLASPNLRDGSSSSNEDTMMDIDNPGSQPNQSSPSSSGPAPV